MVWNVDVSTHQKANHWRSWVKSEKKIQTYHRFISPGVYRKIGRAGEREREQVKRIRKRGRDAHTHAHAHGQACSILSYIIHVLLYRRNRTKLPRLLPSSPA
jgi:hypothetical protein